MKKGILVLISLTFILLQSYSQKGKIDATLITNDDSIGLEMIPMRESMTLGYFNTDKNGVLTIKHLKRGKHDLTINESWPLFEISPNPYYYPLVLKNIPISKEKPVVSLGEIILPKVLSIESQADLPFIEFNGNRYWYSLVSYDYQEFIQFLSVDFDKPNIEGEFNLRPKQKSKPKSIDRFILGIDELEESILIGLAYPLDAMENGIVGTSLSFCVLDKRGRIISIEILNSLCPSIDQNVKNQISRTNGWWYENDELKYDTIYFKVDFMMKGSGFEPSKIQCENLVSGLHVNWIGVEVADEYKLNSKIITNRLNTSLKAKNYNEAVKYLDEAIRRNPFSFELYQLRIMVNTKLGYSEKIADDINKTNNFMNGKSLLHIIED